MPHRIACLVVIETDDPALDPARFDISTTAKRQALRAAVRRALPGLSAIPAVMSETHAMAWLMAMEMTEPDQPQRPPPAHLH